MHKSIIRMRIWIRHTFIFESEIYALFTLQHNWNKVAEELLLLRKLEGSHKISCARKMRWGLHKLIVLVYFSIHCKRNSQAQLLVFDYIVSRAVVKGTNLKFRSNAVDLEPSIYSLTVNYLVRLNVKLISCDVRLISGENLVVGNFLWCFIKKSSSRYYE